MSSLPLQQTDAAPAEYNCQASSSSSGSPLSLYQSYPGPPPYPQSSCSSWSSADTSWDSTYLITPWPLGKGGKPKRIRTAFTEEQLRALEETFQSNNFIKKADRKQLCTQYNMQDRAVMVWFQNRRMKQKKDQAASTSASGPAASVTSQVPMVPSAANLFATWDTSTPAQQQYPVNTTDERTHYCPPEMLSTNAPIVDIKSNNISCSSNVGGTLPDAPESAPSYFDIDFNFEQDLPNVQTDGFTSVSASAEPAGECSDNLELLCNAYLKDGF